MTGIAPEYPALEQREANSSFVVVLLLASAIGMPSVLLWLLPVGQRLIGFGLFLVTALVLMLSGRKLPISSLLLLVGSALMSTITAWYWNAVVAVILIGYFAMGLILVSMASLAEIRRAVETATVILLALVVLGWVAVVYVFQGGEPLFTIVTVGQPVKLFLTTFAVDSNFNLIRPAGIFDEPGAFATFICLCAACRMLLGLSSGRTWALLLGGLVTISLALVLFILVVGAADLFDRRKSRVPMSETAKRRARIAFAAVMIVLVVVMVRYWNLISVLGEFLLDRLKPASGTGRVVAGDSRTEQLMVSLQFLNLKTFLFGADASCFNNVAKCYNMDLGGTNPLAPLVMRGILSQFIYYFILAVFFFKAVTGPHRAVYLGVALMYLQRPYVLAFGYSTWAVMALLIEQKIRQSAALRVVGTVEVPAT